MDLIQVDRFDAQALQAGFYFVADRVGVQIIMHLTLIIPHQRTFGEHVRPLVNTVQRSCYHFFGMAEAIHSGGINPVHAEIERTMNCADRVIIVLRTPGERPIAAADRPGTEANRRNVHVAVAKLSFIHEKPLM